MNKICLRWVTSGKGKWRDLYVGDVTLPVGSVSKDGQEWEGWVGLCGGYLSQKCETREAMERTVKNKVSSWFRKALAKEKTTDA